MVSEIKKCLVLEARQPIKLISGGQTGVDRAALDVGLELGIETGGCCPEGRKAEDGIIPSKYPLRELPGCGYQERTRQNVIDSDGTLIVFFSTLSGGTALTEQYCTELNKPHLLIDGDSISVPQTAEQLKSFINEYRIVSINVAGPRQSEAVDGYRYTQELLFHFFRLLENR